MEALQDKLYVHAGTQNGTILGFQGTLNAMSNLYAYSPNLGAVKCVGTIGRYLITGGFDEIIRLYDLKQKKEKGQLIGHEGTITCIKSFKNFIISGAEDFNIIIWKVKEWSLLHRLKGHKDSVHDIALHDSGKILASVGKDKKIILWNLIQGTKIFRKTMPFNTYKVMWAPEDNLIIMSDNSIVLVSQETNKTIKELPHKRRVNDFEVIDGVVIVAGDDGNLYFWNNLFNAESESFYITFKAHTPRVKRVKLIKIDEIQYLVSCSTDGDICFWEITDLLKSMEFVNESKELEESLKPTYSLHSYQRIITMDVHFESQVFQNGPQNQAPAGVEGEEQGEQEEEEEKVEAEPEEPRRNKNKPQKVGGKIKKKVRFEEPSSLSKKMDNMKKQELAPQDRKKLKVKQQKQKKRKNVKGKLHVEYD